MDSDPGAPLTVSRLSMDPFTSPWLCQMCSGPVGLWPITGGTPCTGVTWLTLFLDQPHSCCFLTTSHYTVDESEKWVICLFLWKLMYMTFCQIATLFHSRSLDPPLSALSTFYFFPWLQSEDNPLVFFKRNYDTVNSTMCTSICLRVITLPPCCRGYINTTLKWTRDWMIKYGMCLLCPRLVASWAKCMNHAFWM